MKEDLALYLEVIILVLGCLGLAWKKKKQLGATKGDEVIAAVIIKNKPLICLHCSNDKFLKREGLLVTT